MGVSRLAPPRRLSCLPRTLALSCGEISGRRPGSLAPLLSSATRRWRSAVAPLTSILRGDCSGPDDEARSGSGREPTQSRPSAHTVATRTPLVMRSLWIEGGAIDEVDSIDRALATLQIHGPCPVTRPDQVPDLDIVRSTIRVDYLEIQHLDVSAAHV